MPTGAFLLDDQDSLTEMPATLFAAELDFQRLLAQRPNLLAGDQIDPDVPRRWLLVDREIGIPGPDQGGARWSLDHLFLDQAGVPTLVEVKRGADPRVRRGLPAGAYGLSTPGGAAIAVTVPEQGTVEAEVAP